MTSNKTYQQRVHDIPQNDVVALFITSAKAMAFQANSTSTSLARVSNGIGVGGSGKSAHLWKECPDSFEKVSVE
ncbi:hypothetical protein HBI88_044620 [Parastagonospora nodorum]|nr:hypothetical protein HBH93_121150 [Parastagonospora nodorum]KAH4965876.1 hypothetical protein HBH73_061810 [Parastagonospora nodorum]KAH5872910.1 hypothetical protein HBI91_063010 [Parastagonospora nodorum]KAH5898093.1 hypothetical protein HBI92_061410 [Parastagonospora nodorum]KAH5939943.1 hypothetical protein HBI88_044620 [Parastagonospora nodorum]